MAVPRPEHAPRPRIGVLGAITLSGNGDPVPVALPRLRLLLAILAANHSTPVAVGRLVELIWPENPPASAESSIQVSISQLRKLLEPDRPPRTPSRYLHTTPGGYRLSVEPDQLDLADFERRVADFHDTGGGPAELEAALEIWSDPPFAEFCDAAWARSPVERLYRLRLGLVAESSLRALADGSEAQIIDALRTEVDRHPNDGRLARLLMIVLYRLGRQAEALGVARKLRSVLRDRHGLDPSPEVERLEQAILAHDPALHRSQPWGTPSGSAASLQPPRLPEPQQLFGRAEELSELAALLQSASAVTLVGPAGAGKTSLARSIAAGADDVRVLFVDLSSVTDDGRVLRMVADSVGLVEEPTLDPQRALLDVLRAEPTLLIIDNAEQVFGGVAAVVSTVAEAQACSVLVTSRRPLGLLIESIHRVEPLALPGRDDDEAEVAASPACQLLAARARVEIDRDNAAILAAIATRLDGLPLALELAAYHLRSVGADDFLRRLEAEGLPAGPHDVRPRHRSLDAALADSLVDLEVGTRTALDALSICAGPIPSRALDQLLFPDGSARCDHALSELIDRGLVAIEPSSDDTRYVLLETVRSFCRRQLASGRRLEHWRDRHAALVQDLARQRSVVGEAALVRLHDVPAEVPAALDWLEERGGVGTDHIQLVVNAGSFWFRAGQPRVARERMMRAVDLHPTADPIWRGIATGSAGLISFSDGQFATLNRLVADALSILEPLGLPGLDMLEGARHLARRELDLVEPAMRRALDAGLPNTQASIAADMAAHAAWFRGDHPSAEDWFDDLRRAAAAAGERYFEGRALRGLAMMKTHQGSPESGMMLCEQSIDGISDWSTDRSTAQYLAVRAAIQWAFRNAAAARSDARAALLRAGTRFDWIPIVVAVPVMTELEFRDGRLASVARLTGWLRGLRDATGVFPPIDSEVRIEEVEASTAEALGDSWAELRAQGASSGLARLVAAIEA